jgi:hypothetical protein
VDQLGVVVLRSDIAANANSPSMRHSDSEQYASDFGSDTQTDLFHLFEDIDSFRIFQVILPSRLAGSGERKAMIHPAIKYLL